MPARASNRPPALVDLISSRITSSASSPISSPAPLTTSARSSPPKSQLSNCRESHVSKSDLLTTPNPTTPQLLDDNHDHKDCDCSCRDALTTSRRGDSRDRGNGNSLDRARHGPRRLRYPFSSGHKKGSTPWTSISLSRFFFRRGLMPDIVNAWHFRHRPPT